MRKELVEKYIESLVSSLGSIRPPITEEELYRLHAAKDYAGMVRAIQKLLRLNLRVHLSLVNSGGPKVPAWISMPQTMPPFGTAAFEKTEVMMYLRKSFLRECRFESVVLAIAHELCHIVLDAIGHPLHTEEEAVDLTMMILGFRDFYVTGRQYQLTECEDHLISGYIVRIGYLTTEEANHAALYLTFRKPAH